MMAGKSASKLKYVNAIPLSDLPKPGGAVGAVVGGLDVCIAVGTDGLIYALGGKAPPTGTPRPALPRAPCSPPPPLARRRF